MSHAHLASVHLGVPAGFAYGRFCDPQALGRWALGSMDLRPAGPPGVYRGVSLFDGSESIVEFRGHPDLLLIDYHVGSLERRVPRVSIRVTPGSDWGLPEASCLAAMTTWRAGWMDEDRWARTRTTHELEVLLFKAQIEADWAGQAET